MKMINDAPVVIINFSGAYKMEEFANNPDFIHIECSDIQGADCICSNDALRETNERIKGLGAKGIHFIDSGDYHYISKLWTDKIKTPFILVLVDHHTDMQPAKISGALTCGDWVDAVIENNIYLREVIIIGAPADSEKTVPKKYKDKVRFVYPQDFRAILKGKEKLSAQGSVYISIDKDVLNTQSAVTNWDQGQMTLCELRRLIDLLMQDEHVIGVDVCGEFPIMKSLFDEEKAADIDDNANLTILNEIM